MSTWTKQKLGALAEVVMGQSPESKYYNERGEGLPFFQGVKDFGEKYPTVTKWTTSANKVANEGDILFSVRAPVGDINVAQYECALGRGVCAIRSKHEQGDFLYFLLHGNIKKITNVGNGAIYDSINKPTLENIELLIPALPTQTRIASVLSAYDDLIENNEKRIKALEEMAQLLYTEWFVKFKFPGHEKIKLVDSGTSYGKIPEGWEVKELGNLIQVKKGKNITRDSISNGNVPVVAGGLDPAYFHDIPNTHSPVVTISASGANAGFTRLYFEDVWASDCSYVDLSITPHVYFFYLFLKNKREEIFRLQRGSAQPHVYPKDLMSLKIISVQEPIIQTFNDAVSPLFELIGNLARKNKNLSKIRDLLIPQLVTGKRELKNI
jgi:type I restriction enzyme S subunit